MNVSVSVIIPFYNASRWLKKSLDSVTKQVANETIEIILVDDGSTDQSMAIIEQAQRNRSIRVIRNERNLGIVASLNRGLDFAQGRFIARMDADDICMPTRFSRQLLFLRETGIDLCGSWFMEFGKGIPRAVRWPHSEAALRTSLLFQNSICHPSVMARREVFEHYRYRENYRLAEDYDLFARIMSRFRIANVPEVLLRYRRHPAQATQAQRGPMELVTKHIRLDILANAGITATEDEKRLHNLIRAPHSITHIDDLLGIEAWLKKLHALQRTSEAKQVISSQWIRACIRAAPLGSHMLRVYQKSTLRGGLRDMLDLSTLATLKLNYGSKPFAVLRRLGLNA